MPFRAQYLADIGLHENPYPYAAGARVRNIYLAARKGSIAHALADELWQDHLHPILGDLAGLPGAQEAFDGFIVTNALAIAATLGANNRGGFGIAQKIINLFMKDLWAFQVIPNPLYRLLHVPVDRGVVFRLQNPPATWTAWTNVVANDADAPAVHDYLGIQASYRALLAHPAAPGDHPAVFESVIEMEQFLWHRMG